MPRDVVFVFGSNLAGRHGKGAALEAAQHWGAQYGVGSGRAYALPTKDASMRTLAYSTIHANYKTFFLYAQDNSTTQFLLTPAGSGLAGYRLAAIREILNDMPALQNVWLTRDWEHV